MRMRIPYTTPSTSRPAHARARPLQDIYCGVLEEKPKGAEAALQDGGKLRLPADASGATPTGAGGAKKPLITALD